MAKHATTTSKVRSVAGATSGSVKKGGGGGSKTAAGSALSQKFHGKAGEGRVKWYAPSVKGDRDDFDQPGGMTSGQYELSFSYTTDGHRWVNVRLSDPVAREDANAAAHSVTKNKQSALEFLKGIGVVTSSGRLTKRHGG